MIEKLKKYWWVIGCVGFLLVFSSQLQAVWHTPERMNEYENAQQDYYQRQEQYIARQEAIEEERYRWRQQQEQVNSNYFNWLRELERR